MRLTNVIAASSMPPEYMAERAAKREAMKELDTIVISDDSRTLSEWSKQFRICFTTGKTENVLSSPIEGNSSMAVDFGNSDMYEYGADIYMKLKGQIDEKYGNDSEKQKLYMIALDDAFETFIGNQSWHAARHLTLRAEAHAKYGVPEGQTKDPLAGHEDFNKDEFFLNLAKTGGAFTKAFTQGAKNGLSAAWENVNKALGGMTTTSVNNISFNDMRIILAGLSTKNDNISVGTGVDWKAKYAAFANNTNLSDFMRDVFRVSGT